MLMIKSMMKSMKKMLRQTFSCLNLNNVWKWEIISAVLIEVSSYFSSWNWCSFFFMVLCWHILFILTFGCVTIVNREMESVGAI